MSRAQRGLEVSSSFGCSLVYLHCPLGLRFRVKSNPCWWGRPEDRPHPQDVLLLAELLAVGNVIRNALEDVQHTRVGLPTDLGDHLLTNATLVARDLKASVRNMER